MSAAPSWTQADLWSLFDLSGLAELGLGRYLVRSLARCTEWFRASGASIFLAEGPCGPYALRAKCGELSSASGDSKIVAGRGIAGLAVKDGQARIVGDPESEPRYASRGIRRRARIASSMVVPLRDPAGECVGVLNLARAHGAAPFGEEDLEQACALASHLALAVSNARLVDRLQATVAETALAHERLKGVLHRVPGGVIILDASGAASDLNGAARSFFGDGQDLPGLLAGAVAPCLAEALTQALAGREGPPARAYDAATDRTWLIEGAPLSDGGSVVAVREVTEHERGQREIERVRRLAEIGQMAAAIAHEIRNPVTGIRAAGQMVASNPEMAAELGAIVEQEALKLNDLCEEFLDFAKPMPLRLTEARLGDVVKGMWERLAAGFAEAQVSANLDIDPDDPIIRLDRRRVEQVAHNLVRNARQACKPGGRVNVRVGNGTLVVQDDGCGMDEAAQEKLFTPFFTTKADGTGLGLSNVRKIVEAHGGSIRVESRPGEGARFCVRFGRSMD